MKTIMICLICVLLTGCSRSFWMPSYDKAETEQKQLIELKKQNVYYERICVALEKIAISQEE